MPATVNQVHQYLLELAKQGHNPVTYTELARRFEMTINGDADVAFWSRLLGEISDTEHGQGNPMLSVLVINEDMNRPGNGFYDLASKLGKYNGFSEMDRMEFYARELQSVYDKWAGET
jgi:hypothetical protein